MPESAFRAFWDLKMAIHAASSACPATSETQVRLTAIQPRKGTQQPAGLFFDADKGFSTESQKQAEKAALMN
ncbi:hypothetical protein [Undibacterium luofuense]|uniref:Uncharacterized protein n=1 Tax=Undibacterium luofuense TaxID=2828733 RepID=A0A941DNH3_9BURK|nr:hypothetical protein [Undibacterium luofuense]MBR7784138.1 hypothetical protein [Undibacterium luofuense]